MTLWRRITVLVFVWVGLLSAAMLFFGGMCCGGSCNPDMSGRFYVEILLSSTVGAAAAPAAPRNPPPADENGN